jgi:hypothetical protein
MHSEGGKMSQAVEQARVAGFQNLLSHMNKIRVSKSDEKAEIKAVPKPKKEDKKEEEKKAAKPRAAKKEKKGGVTEDMSEMVSLFFRAQEAQDKAKAKQKRVDRLYAGNGKRTYEKKKVRKKPGPKPGGKRAKRQRPAG